LASAGAKHTIKLWDVASREEMILLHGHRKEIAKVGFAENGELLYSLGYGETCEFFLWHSQRQSAK
jgi:WD40 repeat protein